MNSQLLKLKLMDREDLSQTVMDERRGQSACRTAAVPGKRRLAAYLPKVVKGRTTGEPATGLWSPQGSSMSMGSKGKQERIIIIIILQKCQLVFNLLTGNI